MSQSPLSLSAPPGPLSAGRPEWGLRAWGGGGGGGTQSEKWYRLRGGGRGRWLSQPKMAKKRGCPLITLYDRGGVRVFASNILHQITIMCIQICS